MAEIVNHCFRLASRPEGLPKRSDFTYAAEPVREPGEGELLVKVHYVSLDPAMRGWMRSRSRVLRARFPTTSCAASAPG